MDFSETLPAATKLEQQLAAQDTIYDLVIQNALTYREPIQSVQRRIIQREQGMLEHQIKELWVKDVFKGPREEQMAGSVAATEKDTETERATETTSFPRIQHAKLAFKTESIGRKQSLHTKTQQKKDSPYNSKDVLSGRGTRSNQHSGNRVFRKLIELNRKTFLNLTNVELRRQLVRSIVVAINNKGGRFLKPEEGLFVCGEETEKWVELDHEEALQKTKQALRDNRLPKKKYKDR